MTVKFLQKLNLVRLLTFLAGGLVLLLNGCKSDGLPSIETSNKILKELQNINANELDLNLSFERVQIWSESSRHGSVPKNTVTRVTLVSKINEQNDVYEKVKIVSNQAIELNTVMKQLQKEEDTKLSDVKLVNVLLVNKAGDEIEEVQSPINFFDRLKLGKESAEKILRKYNSEDFRFVIEKFKKENVDSSAQKMAEFYKKNGKLLKLDWKGYRHIDTDILGDWKEAYSLLFQGEADGKKIQVAFIYLDIDNPKVVKMMINEYWVEADN